MDYLVESLILGVDSIILISCIKKYFEKKKTIAMIAVRKHLYFYMLDVDLLLYLVCSCFAN